MMEGIEKIIEKIELDAKQQVDALIAENEQTLAEMKKQAQQQAAQETADTLEKGKRAAQERLERLISAAQMQGKTMQLALKQQMLDEAFDAAMEKLCALPEKDYVALLADLAAKASVSGKEQLIFSVQERARIGKQVVLAANERLAGKTPAAAQPSQLTLSEQTREMRGGFILVDGAVEINCSFEALVGAQRAGLEKQVAQVLFA